MIFKPEFPKFLSLLYLLTKLLAFASGVSLYSAPTPQSASSASQCVVSAAERHRNKIVRLGVILPFSGSYLWRMQLVRPAVEYARDYVYTTHNLLQNYTLEFDYRDSKCSETDGPLQAIDLYTTRSADVFLGPVCDYAISLIAGCSYSWGIPIISAGALARAFTLKSEYKLLTRVLGAYKHSGEFLVKVLKTFNQTKVGFLLHSNSEGGRCWHNVEAIYFEIKDTLIPDLDMNNVEYFNETKPQIFEKLLLDLSQYCRGEAPSSLAH